MFEQLTHLAAAEATDGASGWHFTKNPQLPIWLLVLFCILCAALAIYLYRAQQKVASKAIIITLTTLRTLLVLLMFLVLLGPGCQYTRNGTANGTLWLLVDQSQSMEQADPQATPVEKIRWADALGYLPAGQRPSRLDRQAARLTALRSDLVHWNTAAAVPADEGDAGTRLDPILAGLKKWNSQFKSVVEAIEKDPLGKNEGETLKSLKSLADAMNAGIGKVEGQGKMDRLAADIPWRDAAAAVDGAVTRLSAVADRFDQALWDKNEQGVKEAAERISKLSRAQLARLVLTREAAKAKKDKVDAADESGSFEELLPKQTLKLVGFGDGAQVILPERDEPAKAIASALAKTPAPATDLGAALRAVGENVSSSEPASVVIVSDGRHNKRERDAADVADAARRLRARGVRVYSLLLGSSQVAPDAAVEQIDSPDWVFKGDTMKLSALLRLDALGGKTVTAELHRLQHVNGQVKETLVDTEEVEVPRPGPAGATAYRKVVSFSEKKDDLPEPGLYDYEVRIREVPDEAITVNNRQAVRVSVKEDKLNVLMIDNQPRYDFRYLKNYLGRDNRVRVQARLLQPARIAMGTDPSKRIEPPPPRKPSTEEKETRDDFQILPETQEEWYPWKVIVLGDLPPESLPKKQQEMIVKAVTDGGATLILLSGPLNMPNSWGTNRAEQPLAGLFPCEPSPDWTPQASQAHLRQGYRPAVATAAQSHLLNQFGIDETDNTKMWAQVHAGLGDPLHEQNWYWHSDLTLARGGANVIWWIKDNATTPTGASPATRPGGRLEDASALENEQRRALLATMNVGLGKVMYFSGDHTWKLRNVNGRNLHERFWGQVIRWVVGSELPAGGQFVRFGSDQPRYVAGETATVTARVTDRKFAPQKGLKFKVLARPVSGSAAEPRAAARVEAEMVEIPEAPGQYRARLGNLPNGQVELSLVGPEVQQLLSDDPKALQKTLTVEVQSGLNLEQRNINADRTALNSIAVAGGGVAVDGAHANVLGDYIPELNYKTTSAEQVALFADAKDPGTRRTHWAFLGIFVALVTAEWVIRKIGGLV